MATEILGSDIAARTTPGHSASDIARPTPVQTPHRPAQSDGDVARMESSGAYAPSANHFTAALATDAGIGNAARAATMSAAHATIGTARLNRLLNPPLGPDRRLPGAQPPDSLPIGATEAMHAGSVGQPLETRMRRPVERTLAADLRDVRVHTGPDANAAAESLCARAFTSGKDIFLGPGERPTDVPLMAHELAHVAQQRGGPAVVQSFNGDPRDPLELRHLRGQCL